MSIGLTAVLVTAAAEMVGVIALWVMAYRMNGKMKADDAALYLQGRRIEEIIKEMRQRLAEG